MQPIDAELGEALENLRAMAGAAAVRVLRASAEACCAHDQSRAEGANIPLGVTVAGCSHLLDGRAHLLMPPHGTFHADKESETRNRNASESEVTGTRQRARSVTARHNGGGVLCVHCRLTTGDTLALQLGVWDAAPLTADQRDKLTRLSVPVLMWARHALEIQALEARQAELEARSRADLALAIDAQEEREWLAYEVHDRVAQTLASVFHQFQTVESLTQSLPEIHRVAVRGSLLLREAIREARNIMNEIQPPVLADLGLMPLVEEELRHFREETGCRTRTALTCGERLPHDVEVAVFRILHEGLTNIRRHARAKEVAVSLHCNHEGVRLEIEDDGVGFDTDEVLPRKRVSGLLSMQRRAEIVRGSCRIQSQPGKGTRLSVWVPWEGAASPGPGGARGD